MDWPGEKVFHNVSITCCGITTEWDTLTIRDTAAERRAIASLFICVRKAMRDNARFLRLMRNAGFE